MNPMTWLNSQWWLRPAMMIVTGAAYLIQQICPPYTMAHHAASWVFGLGAAGAAGSLGQSNSGLPPPEKADVSNPDPAMTPPSSIPAVKR